MTKRNLRALPRSDRARDGVDIGVRPFGPILLCAGDVVNVMGENAIPKNVFLFYDENKFRRNQPRFLFGVRPGVNGI